VLVMEVDAFVQLKASVMEGFVPTIKYYRGCQKSRQTSGEIKESRWTCARQLLVLH